MSDKISEYSTKLKSFTYLAFLILVLSGSFLVSGIIDGDTQSLSESVSGGLLGLFAGFFLLYFGNKKRTLVIYSDKIEYLKPEIDFESSWNDVVLVKSFQEMNKKSENLIIMTKDEQILSISTAFFDRDKLVSAFRDMKHLLKDRPEITFEDDRLWSE